MADIFINTFVEKNTRVIHKVALSDEHNTRGLSGATERPALVKEWNVTNGLQHFLVWLCSLVKNTRA